GENTLIAAAFKTAGSTKIGSRCMIAGDVSVSDHINIADDTVLVGHSCVRSNINSPGTYGGDPVRPLPDFLKTLNTLPLLPKLRKDVARILRHMGLEKE
ncbi:MAG: UDP-3-O-(3-hydroxymyristoyl)glucosamine N-acyltransferase, partial [Bdellovibrionaceae bacterium]|nr:UDP-3-O-(3-hydroxymyristoyl)glucosamine N-acyltransferase [Pseudobdellovibrionaceae bacterium]